MSITLLEQIKLLTTPDQFHALLRQPRDITITWGGQRLLSVIGFPGRVEIDVLVRHFLYTAPITEFTQSLKERVAWYDLWDVIQFVYQQSQEVLQKTWICKHFSTVDQYSNALIEDNDKVKTIFLAFWKEDFIRIWPDDAKRKWTASQRAAESTIKVIVSRDMIVEAIERGHA